MNTLSYLGIYPDAIEDAVEKAESLVSETGHGSVRDLDDYNELAKDYIDFSAEESITNSIIYSYFAEAVNYAEEAVAKVGLKDFEVDYYVNCNDSHLTVNGCEYSGNNEFVNEVKNLVVEKLEDRLLLDFEVNEDIVEETKQEALQLEYDNLHDMLQGVSDVFVDTLCAETGIGVDIEINEEKLTADITIYKKGGDIAASISGEKSFISSIENPEFKEAFENAVEQNKAAQKAQPKSSNRKGYEYCE